LTKGYFGAYAGDMGKRLKKQTSAKIYRTSQEEFLGQVALLGLALLLSVLLIAVFQNSRSNTQASPASKDSQSSSSYR